MLSKMMSKKMVMKKVKTFLGKYDRKVLIGPFYAIRAVVRKQFFILRMAWLEFC